MRSQQLRELLQLVVTTDLKSGTSIIDFFLSNDVSGGWEAWLQTVFARSVFATNEVGNFNREVKYTGTTKKCDLWFQSRTGGTDIWVELKAQRNRSYTGTAVDFSGDIAKIIGLADEFKAKNVIVAMAVLKLAEKDKQWLNDILNRGRAGAVNYLAFDGNKWNNVTNNLRDTPSGQCLLTVYSAA